MEPQAHPLNRWFEWVPTHGPFRRVSAADARRYDVDGYFVLDDALDAGTVRMLLAEIDPIEAEMEARLRELPGKRFFIARADEITFAPHLVTRSAVLRGFCAGALFRDLAHDLIGPTVRLYWEQSVYKKPETDADFPWHQDNGYTYVEPQQYLTCWIALDDRSRLALSERRAGRGAGAAARRQHRRLLQPHAAPDRAEPHRRRAQSLHRSVCARRGPHGAGRFRRRRTALRAVRGFRAAVSHPRRWPAASGGLSIGDAKEGTRRVGGRISSL